MLPLWRLLFRGIHEIKAVADDVIRLANARGATISTAESLTGGMIGAALTAIPGASRAYWGGYTVYSPEAKTALLGVSPETLGRFGTVSAETAEAMATGALERSGSDFSVAVTGVAGPDGGTAENPVGTVWISLAWAGWPRTEGRIRRPETHSRRFSFRGTRDRVRAGTVLQALRLLAAQLDR